MTSTVCIFGACADGTARHGFSTLRGRRVGGRGSAAKYPHGFFHVTHFCTINLFCRNLFSDLGHEICERAGNKTFRYVFSLRTFCLKNAWKGDVSCV